MYHVYVQGGSGKLRDGQTKCSPRTSVALFAQVVNTSVQIASLAAGLLPSMMDGQQSRRPGCAGALTADYTLEDALRLQ
jgi:hypothetical protein